MFYDAVCLETSGLNRTDSACIARKASLDERKWLINFPPSYSHNSTGITPLLLLLNKYLHVLSC